MPDTYPVRSLDPVLSVGALSMELAKACRTMRIIAGLTASLVGIVLIVRAVVLQPSCAPALAIAALLSIASLGIATKVSRLFEHNGMGARAGQILVMAIIAFAGIVTASGFWFFSEPHRTDLLQHPYLRPALAGWWVGLILVHEIRLVVHRVSVRRDGPARPDIMPSIAADCRASFALVAICGFLAWSMLR